MVIIICVFVYFLSIYIIYIHNSSIKCNNAKFSEWKKHLKVWEPFISKYDCDIIEAVKNKKQYHDDYDRGFITCYSKTNNTEYLKLLTYKSCKIKSLRDFFHCRNCCNIHHITFYINTYEPKTKYSYRIMVRNDLSFAFNKCLVENEESYRDGSTNHVDRFSSSEELFADFLKEYDRQELLCLFS